MHRSSHKLLLLAGAALLAGCMTIAPDPGTAAIPTDPALDFRGASADPAGWAAAAQAGCASRDFDAKLACYERAVVSVLREAGVRPAMETIDALAARDPDAQQHGHVLAHAVGLGAYRGADHVGHVFAECTPSFQSGCYHGVIQAYFAELQAAAGRSLDAAALNRLCADHRGADGDRWLLFQCAHGMGHGLVAFFDHQLPRALAGCDLLDDAWEREGCYGGAFMENLVNATMPHHAPDAARHASRHGDGAHAAHEHAAHEHAAHEHALHADRPGDAPGAEAGAFPPLDPADPHYPCSVLDARYRQACYSMQSSAVLFWAAGDVRAGIEFCADAPEDARHTCYVSLGRDINAYTGQNARAALEHCLAVGEPYRAACFIGVAKNRIDVTADAADGVEFCRLVPAGAGRARCFQAVGEQIAVLTGDPDRRAALCEGLAPEDARACRSGASVREVAGAASR